MYRLWRNPFNHFLKSHFWFHSSFCIFNFSFFEFSQNSESSSVHKLWLFYVFCLGDVMVKRLHTYTHTISRTNFSESIDLKTCKSDENSILKFPTEYNTSITYDNRVMKEKIRWNLVDFFFPENTNAVKYTLLEISVQHFT